jgi:hypothetical protein
MTYPQITQITQIISYKNMNMFKFSLRVIKLSV